MNFLSGAAAEQKTNLHNFSVKLILGGNFIEFAVKFYIFSVCVYISCIHIGTVLCILV